MLLHHSLFAAQARDHPWPQLSPLSDQALTEKTSAPTYVPPTAAFKTGNPTNDLDQPRSPADTRLSSTILSTIFVDKILIHEYYVSDFRRMQRATENVPRNWLICPRFAPYEPNREGPATTGHQRHLFNRSPQNTASCAPLTAPSLPSCPQRPAHFRQVTPRYRAGSVAVWGRGHALLATATCPLYRMLRSRGAGRHPRALRRHR